MELLLTALDHATTFALDTPYVLSIPALALIAAIVIGGFVISKAQEMEQ